MRRRAKFGWNRSKRGWDMAIFRRHLEFLNFWNFNGRNAQKGQTTSPCQISSKSVKPRPRYCDFPIFQDGGRRHLGKSKNRHISTAVWLISTKFGMVTQFGPLKRSNLNFKRLKIWDGGGCHLENSKNRHILAAVWRISTKFDTVTEFHRAERLDR